MRPIKLTIETKTQKYPIVIGTNLTLNILKIIEGNSIYFKKCLLVVDKNVPKKKLFNIKKSLQNKNLRTFVFNAKEINKNQNTINKILNILLEENFSRDDCLISIGGGITGDISGFAASLFKRGLKFINVPTTLLAQVDSSIGGKTGINTSHGKNLIGSFYQPLLVISDTQFLKSLPRRELICGYGEILKHSLIADKKFFNFLNKNIRNIFKLSSPFIEKTIFESCKIKKKVVEKDEKEKNVRKVLNLGHTFAHAYEATIGYNKGLNHGEAVLLGIMSAVEFSRKKNILKKNDYEQIIEHLKKLNYCNLNKYFKTKDISKIIFYMKQDKKNKDNKINLILLKSIAKPILNKSFEESSIRLFLKTLIY